MKQPLSYLGLLVIPIVSVLVVLGGYYAYYANGRLAQQLLVTSQPSEFIATVGGLTQTGASVRISQLDPLAGKTVITWQKALLLDAARYEQIDIMLTMPENYRGLSLVYRTAETTNAKPILYAVGGVASFNVSELLDTEQEDAEQQIVEMGFMVDHELYEPLIIESVRLVPKSLNVARFVRLVLLNFAPDVKATHPQGARELWQMRLFMPLVFFAYVGGVLMLLMVLFYQRVFGLLRCVFVSLAMILVGITVLFTLQLLISTQHKTTRDNQSADDLASADTKIHTKGHHS